MRKKKIMKLSEARHNQHDQVETRILKYPCYTTKTGLQIGSMYTPPQRNTMSREDEFWQRQFLRNYRSVQQIGITREVADTVLYIVSVIATLVTAIVILFE